MKLREEILKEHSKKQCLKIVKWVGDDKKRYAELMHLMLTYEYRVAQRAAYPISYCVRKHPALVQKNDQKNEREEHTRCHTQECIEDIGGCRYTGKILRRII